MLKALLFVVALGAVVFLVISMIQRRGGGGGGQLRKRGPVAPDDDPQFLRGLDDQLWQEKRRQRPNQDGTEGQPDSTGEPGAA